MKIGDHVWLDQPLSSFNGCQGVILEAASYYDIQRRWLVRLEGVVSRWCNEEDLRPLHPSPEEQELRRRQEHAARYF